MIDSMSGPLNAAQFATPIGGPQGLHVPGKDASAKEVEAVAQKLEGVFFSLFVKEMRKTMTDGSLFGEGPEAETYEGFFDQMMGEQLGRTGGLGIADMVVENAEKNRERISMEQLRTALDGIKEEKVVSQLAANEKGESDARKTTQKTG